MKAEPPAAVRKQSSRVPTNGRTIIRVVTVNITTTHNWIYGLVYIRQFNTKHATSAYFSPPPPPQKIRKLKWVGVHLQGCLPSTLDWGWCARTGLAAWRPVFPGLRAGEKVTISTSSQTQQHHSNSTDGNVDKTGNVRTTQKCGAFAQSLLPRKSNKNHVSHKYTVWTERTAQ
jgi:hypothetical protein